MRRMFCGTLWTLLFHIAVFADASGGFLAPANSREAIKPESAATERHVLKPVSTVRCPLSVPDARESMDPAITSALGRDMSFDAAKHFTVDGSSRAKVKISWLGAGFTQRYTVKIEPRGAPPAALRIFVLTGSAQSIAIAATFHRPYETRLADLWCLLKLQPNGEAGVLLINAQPNLFFVRNAAGRLGVVDVLWSGMGWEIGASPLTNGRSWPAGLQVIAP